MIPTRCLRTFWTRIARLMTRLEKIYIGRPFKNDIERLEHLFKLYGEMTAENDKEAASA